MTAKHRSTGGIQGALAGSAATAVLCALALAACSPQPVVPTTATLNYEGLKSINAKRFARAEVRPGVNFTHYKAVQARAPELEFRTPDRSQMQFPLSDEQKTRFREALAASLRKEFAANSSLTFVDHTGPEVASLEIRVIDIGAVVPPSTAGQAGRAGIALDATGTVTFVIEVSDSESGELLARGVETRSVSGFAVRQGGQMLTAWNDIEALCDRWAEASRTGLEELLRYDGA
jgi:Protein of unknown function (DUF3313)